MKASEFVFDYVHQLRYKCHKMNPNRSGSYIDSLDWIKNKKAAIYPVNRKDNKYFQYAVTVTLNYEEIENNPERTTKFKPFINKYNQNGTNYASQKEDWKKFQKNNATITLNVFQMERDEKLSLNDKDGIILQ